MVLLWLKAHAAFVQQQLNRRGELVDLAPAECICSLLDLQKSLGLTPKEARCALDYLFKNDLVRVVTAKNYSKALFPESIGWTSCAKYMCKNLHKKDCTKRGTVQGTDEGTVQGTVQGTLSDKNNEVISDGCDENEDLRGTVQGTDEGTVQGTDEGKGGAHFGPGTLSTLGLPASNNTKELITKKKESLSSCREDEREDFFKGFEGMEKSIEEQFHRQFAVRVKIRSELQVKAALSMLFQARRLDKHFESPAGLFTHIAGGAGSYIIPDHDWNPFGSVAVSSFSPPREVAELVKAAAERTSPERLAEIKAAAIARRKASQSA